MTIESGPTRERVIRTTIPLIMVGVFAVWFAYDGWVGYPKRNFVDHLEQLSAEERAQAQNAPIYPKIVEGMLSGEMVSKIQTAIMATGQEAKRKGLEKVLGVPPSWESNGVWYYFGPAYRLRVSPPDDIDGVKTTKTTTDILGQKVISVVLSVGTVALLWLIISVLRTHLVLDAQGIVFGKCRPISWDVIKELRADSFDRKGWVDLIYTENGTDRKLRLDDYHLAKFDQIIDAICDKKGFKNPLPVVTGQVDQPKTNSSQD